MTVTLYDEKSGLSRRVESDWQTPTIIVPQFDAKRYYYRYFEHTGKTDSEGYPLYRYIKTRKRLQ